MADSTGNMLKRRNPEDDDGSALKKSRSNNGSPAPPANGAPAPGRDVQKMLAEARAKAEAVRARLAGANNASSTSSAPTSTMSKIEQMKARVAAATQRAQQAAMSSNSPSPSPAPSAYMTPPPFEDGMSRARGGLDIGLHPALLGDSTQDARSSKGRQAMQPKFATTMANRRTESPAPAGKPKAQLDLSGPSIEEVRSNPYFDPALGPKTATAKPRKSRELVFNQKGKYIQQAAALRRQAQLEAMKKRIAEQARKAGIDEDLETEKSFVIQAPPAIEWWDEGLVDGPDYSALDDPSKLKISSPDSIITIYVQHPVLLEPPQEKNKPAPKPMYLTSKEQAKLRRQRRMAEHKEQQAKIRLGLEPPPPPKVKKSNLMRVLGEQAVKDPTAVEARVNREIAERADNHERANEERKLTKEQRHEKLAEQKDKDAQKGVFMTVYKINSLANGRHRFKINRNADQMALTGVCIMHPKMNLVVVEGGQHSINDYKKLMLNRIDWTENERSVVREGNKEALRSWLLAEDENGELRDLSLNQCQLVWEGPQKQRAFRKWLGGRTCETDSDARDVLSRAKVESFWTLAKGMKGQEQF